MFDGIASMIPVAKPAGGGGDGDEEDWCVSLPCVSPVVVVAAAAAVC